MKKIAPLITLLCLSSSFPAQASDTCFARFVPERDDDFAWENDKVAFRAYGPFYRGKTVNNGIDCWLKRVDYPIINKWYADNLKGKSYHVDHGEGYDPYHVGTSRGCGGLALWIDGKLIDAMTFTEYEVLETGAEQTEFILKYEWEHAGDKYAEEKRIQLKAGSQLFYTQSTFWKNGELAVGLPIAVGLTTHEGKAKTSIDLQQGWISGWETIDGDGLGTGVLMSPDRIKQQKLIESAVKDESHVLLITETDAKGQIEFFSGYGWQRAGEITSEELWIDYLSNYHNAIEKSPLPENIYDEASILQLMERVNNYSLENPWRETDRNWIRATWYSGVMEAYYATGDIRYLEQADAWGTKHEWKIGQEGSGFNRLFCSMTWLESHLISPDPQKIEPTIKGLEVDKTYAPAVGKVWFGHEPHQTDMGWAYADGLFGAPAFAMLHKITGEQKYLDYLHDAFWRVTDKILDPQENLYYRDPNYIGKKSRYGKKVIWSRGNGWVFAGLPRVIQHLSKDDPNYDRYVDLYKRMAKALASKQQNDGFWRANLGDSQDYLMPESSGTAFFIAGYGWGIREGILDAETYLPVVIRAWDALVSAIHPNGLMGWVQPVDAAPRPSHPRTTQEYGTGLFLSAGGQMYRLVKEGFITHEAIANALPQQNHMLPVAALQNTALTEREHPLSKQLNSFIKNQMRKKIKPTSLDKNDYLDVIAGQVKAMHAYQDTAGRIIDPVDKEEKYYTTPCYAHSVGILAKAEYPIAPEILEGGMKALDQSLKVMATGKAPGGHSDFFTWPMVWAYELLQPFATPERKNTWKIHLEKIDKTKYAEYREPLAPTDHHGFYKLYASHFANNWNLVHVAGEFGRVQNGFGDPWYVDYCMTMQLRTFSPLGMYFEYGPPPAYDLFSRYHLSGMLQRGYDSFLHKTYRDILWRGAWTSLFMQSPFGELPTGHRSSHHIWNEAEQAVVFEIYATAYAKEGKLAEAGAFKRAARLSLQSIKEWIRPDGSGYIVKNRFPIEAKHGYENYSKHSCYNMLAMSMLAQAWEFADDHIEELPCPAEVGGFAFNVPAFSKVFANVDGNYVEYNTRNDHQYTPTGLVRVHLAEGHPQTGPSDGCSAMISGEGNDLAIGPSWQVNGHWTSLAQSKGSTSQVTILEESPDQVSFKVSYSGLTQVIAINNAGLTVTDNLNVDKLSKAKVSFPMFITDGLSEASVSLNANTASVSLDGKGTQFEILEPKNLTIQRSGTQLKHRNGVVEEAFAETTSNRIIYKISAKTP